MIGLSVDPRHYEELDALASDVAALGVTIVRTVIKPDEPPEKACRWWDACQENGLDVLWVFASESFASSHWGECIADYRRQYGPHRLHYAQFANEPDQEGESSWTMPAGAVNILLAIARRELPDSFIVGPGLASGQASYLEGMSLEMDALALHPYQESRETIAHYISTYRAYWDGPIWFTEYADVGMTAALGWYGEPFKFCLSDRMVPGYGLWDLHDQPKAEAAIFTALARGGPKMAGQIEIDEQAPDFPFGGRWTRADGSPIAIEEWTRPDGLTVRRAHYEKGDIEELVEPDGASRGTWWHKEARSFR